MVAKCRASPRDNVVLPEPPERPEIRRRGRKDGVEDMAVGYFVIRFLIRRDSLA